MVDVKVSYSADLKVHYLDSTRVEETADYWEHDSVDGRDATRGS